MYSIARVTKGIISHSIQRRVLAPRSLASTIAIKNLPFTITSDGVQALMKELELESSKVEIPLTANGKAKGWALLDFEDDTDAELAIDSINGHELEGRKLKANMRGLPMMMNAPKKKVVSSSSTTDMVTTNPEDIDFFTELRIDLLKDASRENQDDILANILYDDDKFVDQELELKKEEKILLSKKEINLKKRKAREDFIKYQDESPEDRKIRVSAEAQEEEYRAECAAMSKALVRKPTGDGEDELTDDMPGNWIESVVSVDRVQKIIKGGSIMSYRVLVVVGNARGAGGFGIGKAADPATATARAIREAKKNLIVVDRYKNTALVHSVEGKHNSCRVVLRAVPPGAGTKGGKVVKTILEQMGIADCTGKAVGRRQPYAVVRATFKALARHTSVADISRSRGRRVLDVMWRSGKE